MSREEDFNRAFNTPRSRVIQEQARAQRWISVGFAIGGGLAGGVLIALGYGIGRALGWW